MELESLLLPGSALEPQAGTSSAQVKSHLVPRTAPGPLKDTAFLGRWSQTQG